VEVFLRGVVGPLIGVTNRPTSRMAWKGQPQRVTVP
jgi:hypothetical protein